MSCTYYEYKSGFLSGDYWCNKKECRVDSDTYYKYCRDYNYDECPIFKTNQSSGCFITTITCQILGKNDDDLILNDLRAFRDNILQQNTQYFDILKEYDSIGPVIANYLFNDPDKIQLATCLYQNIIIPINELIQKKEYQKAVEAYYQMTLLLINYYGLKHHYNTLKENDYDYPNFNPRLAGHGRKRIKTPSPKLG